MRMPQKLFQRSLKLYPGGEVLGSHTGIHNFTFGQRKGLGVSYTNPLYVIKVDAKNGDVWLGEEEYLYSSTLTLKKMNWLDEFSDTDRFNVKIRFAHAGAAAKIISHTSDSMTIEFETPQRAITPGQAAVFYRESQLLGGGWIQ
ncbi:MAG: aminomethyltransferase beta-barrel domain-containing protein [Bdellovibrionales bacterium]